MVKFWQEYLRLTDWVILTEPINKGQVVYPEDLCECDRYYIGVQMDHKTKHAVIYHDRELTDDDVCHELLHIKFKDFDEDQINMITAYFLKINGK